MSYNAFSVSRRRKRRRNMAGALPISRGTKIQFALDTPVRDEAKFDMVSTFNKELDESAFLTSIPMVDGKAYIPDENQKLLFRYEAGEETFIGSGYVDDVVKEGIRRYWKVRRMAEQRKVIRRVDVRLKVELPVLYMQDSWPLNARQEITKEHGETMDISNNGLAVCLDRRMEVGETCRFTLPRIGTPADGQPELEVVGVICWVREMPKGGPFRFVTGIQLRFSDSEDRAGMQEYVAYVKKRYKL